MRIFNFQDDNFFLSSTRKQPFNASPTSSRSACVRPELTRLPLPLKPVLTVSLHEAIRILDELGLFRVFLGVENASAAGVAHT